MTKIVAGEATKRREFFAALTIASAEVLSANACIDLPAAQEDLPKALVQPASHWLWFRRVAALSR
jgi:hypothetical protein